MSFYPPLELTTGASAYGTVLSVAAIVCGSVEFLVFVSWISKRRTARRT